MNINKPTAKIKVDTPGARPSIAIGPTRITFHLGRGYIAEGNTETFNDAINFMGTVQAATTPDEFLQWNFRFLQFQKVEFLGFFYAGPKRSSGQITLLVHKPPALAAPLHLDSEDEYSPWTHSFDASLSGAKITAISGDHPASRAPRKMTNNISNSLNYLFHFIDKRRFWTVFTAEDPAGNFQHLAHVAWSLRYNYQFVWRNGEPQLHRNESTFSNSGSKSGPPGDSELQNLLTRPSSPHSNPTIRKALRDSVLGGKPNRSDKGERIYRNLPNDFFS
jgi:hypothetical protein